MAQAVWILALPLPFVKQKCAVMPPRPRVSPVLVISVGILAVSTSSLFINFALRDGAHPLVIAAYRLTLATLILLPIVLWRHRTALAVLSGRDWALALGSGLFLGLHFATWVSSLAYTSVASSVVLVDTAPLFVALLAGVVLKEKSSPTVWLGLLVALAGAVTIAVSDACGAA